MIFNQNLTSTDILCKNLVDGDKTVAVSDIYDAVYAPPLNFNI